MREILFRAKAINRDSGYHRTNYKNGDWVYGLISKLYDEQFTNLPAEMTNTGGISGIEIDHKTIGQYTGLTDKNGNKIFEGDILNGLLSLHPDRRIFQVVYEDNGFYFLDEDEIGWHPDHIVDYEIIGNIHDNPELLKGEMIWHDILMRMLC